MMSFQYLLYTALQFWMVFSKHLPVLSDQGLQRQRQTGPIRQKKGQGLYSALKPECICSLPLQLQYPCPGIPADLPAEEQQWVQSKGGNCLILGINKSRSRGQQLRNRHRRKAMANSNKARRWAVIYECSWITKWKSPLWSQVHNNEMNSLIYSLSLLPSSGARKHSLRLLMKSLTELWDQTFTNIQALIEPLFIRANYLILSRSNWYKFPTLLSLENLTSINLKWGQYLYPLVIKKISRNREVTENKMFHIRLLRSDKLCALFLIQGQKKLPPKTITLFSWYMSGLYSIRTCSKLSFLWLHLWGRQTMLISRVSALDIKS